MSKVIVLADPDGGAGPIGLANQFVGDALRDTSGTLHSISAIDVAGQSVTIASSTGLTVGDRVQLRHSSGRKITALLHPASVAADGRVKDVLQRTDLPATVNLVPNPVGRVWTGGSSVVPDDWAVVGSATITKQTAAPFLGPEGPASIKVVTTSNGNGVATPVIPLAATALSPYVSGYMDVYVAAGNVRIELVLSDGVTSWVVPDGVSAKAMVTQKETYTCVGIDRIDAYAAAATSARLRIVQDGADAATVYISAAQLTNTAGQASFIEGSGPRQLFQAGNAAVAIRGPVQPRYVLTYLDLARMLQPNSDQLRAVLGAQIRVINDVLGISDAVRIIVMDEDLKVEGNTKLTLSDRPQDIASLWLSRSPNTAVGHSVTSGYSSGAGAARYVDDVVCTIASPNVSSATAKFTASDVGETAWLFGGTVAQLILKTTIVSVSSGTAVVLAANAGRSATGLTMIVGRAADVLTLAGGIGGTRAGNALVDNAGKLGPGVADINARNVGDFFSKPDDTLDSIANGDYKKTWGVLRLIVNKTAATDTSVTFQPVGYDDYGGPTPSIALDSMTGVTNNMDGTYTIARPATGAGANYYTFTANATTRVSASIVVSVPEQAGVGLIYNQCNAKVTGVTATTVTITVTATVEAGTPQVKLVAITGSASLNSGTALGTLTTNGSAWTFDRGAFAAGIGQVQFRAVTSGAVDDDDFVDIAEVGRDTVAVIMQADVIASGASSVTVRVAVADPYPQGSGSATITYGVAGTSGVSPASGGTVTPAATLTGASGTYIDYLIYRSAAGTGTGRVTFQATAANRVSDSDSVDVPEALPDIPPAFTVPDLTLTQTAQDATTTTYVVSVSDPSGQGISILTQIILPFGGTGSVAGAIGVYTITTVVNGETVIATRGTWDQSDAPIAVVATAAGGGVTRLDVMLQQQGTVAPGLSVVETQNSGNFSYAFSIAHGSLLIDGGSPGSTPKVVTRPSAGGTPTSVEFVATNDGIEEKVAFVVWPQEFTMPDFTPAILFFYSTGEDAGSDIVTLAASQQYAPGGYYWNLAWTSDHQGSAGGSGNVGSSGSPISFPYGFNVATNTGFDLDVKNPGITNGFTISFTLELRAADDSVLSTTTYVYDGYTFI